MTLYKSLGIVMLLCFTAMIYAASTQKVDIPYMKERRRQTEYPDLTSIPKKAFSQALWNIPQQITEVVSSHILSRSGVPGADSLSNFFGRGTDVLVDSFRWSGLELLDSALINNIDLLFMLPAIMISSRYPEASRTLMSFRTFKHLLMLGSALYEPVKDGAASINAMFRENVIRDKYKIEVQSAELNSLIDIIWQQHPKRLYGSEFKIILYPERANCIDWVPSTQADHSELIKHLACSWPADRVYILSYIYEREGNPVRVFQLCTNQECGKLHELPDNNLNNKPGAFCWLEQLLSDLLKGPSLGELIPDYGFTTSYNRTPSVSDDNDTISDCSLVDTSPIDSSSLTRILKLLYEETVSEQPFSRRISPVTEPFFSQQNRVELINSITKLQLDGDTALTIDMSDHLTPRLSIITGAPRDLSQYIQGVTHQWTNSRFHQARIEASLMKTMGVLLQTGLYNFFTRQSANMIDVSVTGTVNYLRKTAISCHGGKEGGDTDAKNSQSYSTAASKQFSARKQDVKSVDRSHEDDDGDGSGSKKPPSGNSLSPKEVFEPKCQQCSQALTEEQAINGIIICDTCQGYFSDNCDGDDKSNNIINTGYSSSESSGYPDSDTDSCSGSGSSTSSESESNDETEHIEFMEVALPGRRKTFRPVLINNVDGKPLTRKRRVNLWNRHGNKKQVRRLKKPYERHLYTNHGNYRAPAKDWFEPFPPLKTVEVLDTLTQLECKKCSKIIPPDQQAEHNSAHFREYLNSLDNDKPQACPWCQHEIPFLTIGYHLQSEHSELVFGLNHKNSRLQAIELFSGIGGLSLGLKRAGITVLAGFDIDGSCRQTYSTSHDAKFIQGDIVDLKGQMLEDLGKLFSSGSINVVVAGVPCVTFSSLSKKKYSEEDKFSTLVEFERVIQSLKPDIFVMENVPSIASLSSIGYFKFICNMRLAGYFLSQKVLLASEYGTPQHRKRLILLASRYGYIKHSELLNSIDDAPSLKQAIGYLPKIGMGQQHSSDPMHVTAVLQDDILEAIRYTPVGYRSGHLQWPSSVRKASINNVEEPKLSWRMWRHNLYGRMEYDEPANTITTNALHPSGGPYTHPEPDQHRGLSVRELMNIQGFPRAMLLKYESRKVRTQSWRFPANQAARHVGNAVPPPLAEAIGMALLKHERELRQPLPNSYFFPIFGNKHLWATSHPESRSTSILTSKQSRKKFFSSLAKGNKKSYVQFVYEKTGVSPKTDPQILKPKPQQPVSEKYPEFSLSKSVALDWSPAFSAFTPYGTIKMTVPEAVSFHYPEISGVTSKFKFSDAFIQKISRAASGIKRKLPPPSSSENGSKKRKLAGTAGQRGFICPVAGCKAPGDLTSQYSLTSTANWFDHIIAEHGGGIPYKARKIKKVINLGEAVLAEEKLIRCKIGSCQETTHSFQSFTELGKHIKDTHSSELEHLQPNSRWKKNELKVKPIGQLNSASAGKRYQTRFGEGFYCAQHQKEKLRQTPEALGQHWFLEHMKLGYFCPNMKCVSGSIKFQTSGELYKHMNTEHTEIKPDDLDFSCLNNLLEHQ